MNVTYEMICEKNSFVEYRYFAEDGTSSIGAAVFTKDGLAYVVEKAANPDDNEALFQKLAQEVKLMAQKGTFAKKGVA